MSKDTGAAPEDPPFADLSAFPADVIEALLGKEPPYPSLWAVQGRRRPRSRALNPSEWPSDKAGFEYFHRGAARLVREAGLTAGAAAAFRRELERGLRRAVVIDDADGIAHDVPPEHWRAAVTSAEMLWTGRGWKGDLYLVVPAATEGADDWRIGLGQSFASWGRGAAAQTEARRRLAAVGDDAPPKEQINAVLTVMARECGRTLADDTIDRSLRRAPKTPRTRSR